MLAKNTLSRVIDFFTLSDVFEPEMVRSYKEFFDTVPNIIDDLKHESEFSNHEDNSEDDEEDSEEAFEDLLDDMRELMHTLRSEDHSHCSESGCAYMDGDEKEEYEHLDRERGLYIDWLLFDFRLKNGSSPMEYFVDKNPYALDADTIELYRQFCKSSFAAFEIIGIKRGSSLTLRSLRDSTIVEVREMLGTLDACHGGVVAGRVSDVLEHKEIIGNMTQIGISLQLLTQEHQARLAQIKTAKALREFFYQSKTVRIPPSLITIPKPRFSSLEDAKKSLDSLLRQFKLDSFFSANLLERWTHERGDDEPELGSNILAGLVNSSRLDISHEGQQELLETCGAVMNFTPRKKDRLSPNARYVAHQADGGKPFLTVSNIYTPARIDKPYLQGMEQMQKGLHKEALENFDTALKELIAQKTTFQDVYRLFANRGSVLLELGDFELGYLMYVIALTLNPRYQFAWQQMEKADAIMYHLQYPRRKPLIPLSRVRTNLPRIPNNKRIRADLGHQYYLFVKELGLSFEHDPGVSQTSARTLAEDGTWRKIERNEPCPCKAKKPDGTRLKFKHCCGKP